MEVEAAVIGMRWVHPRPRLYQELVHRTAALQPHLADTGARAADGGRETEPAAPAPAKAKKAATVRNGANAPRKARTGTKQALVVEMLRRSEGATVDQIMEATGWQRHTVRGAFAGALKKKLGLAVTSEKVEDGARVYRVAG